MLDNNCQWNTKMVIQNDHIAGTIATLQLVLRRSKNKIIKQTPTGMVRLYEVGENDTQTHTNTRVRRKKDLTFCTLRCNEKQCRLKAHSARQILDVTLTIIY